MFSNPSAAYKMNDVLVRALDRMRMPDTGSDANAWNSTMRLAVWSRAYAFAYRRGGRSAADMTCLCGFAHCAAKEVTPLECAR